MEKEKNYVSELKKYARKNCLVVRYEEVCSNDPEQAGRFLKRVKINSRVFDIGWGYTKKQAKQNAAKSALESLSEKENPRPVKRNSAKKCRTPFKQANATKVNLKEHEAKDCFTAAKKEAKDGAAKLVHYHISGNEATEELLWSAAPDEGAAAMLYIPPTSPAISDGKSRDSVVSTDSPTSSPDQEQKPVVKARRHLEPYFQDACQISVKDVIPEKKTIESDSSEKTPPPTVPQVLRFTSDFDCITLLGTGGFGHVFKVKEKLTGIYFAVKIVTCKENRDLREVETLAAHHHRNIVRYFSCWIDNNGYKMDGASDSDCTTQPSISDSSAKYLYIKLELCDPKTLRVWIDEKNTQNVKKSLRDFRRRECSLTIAKQIVSGVEYIHSKNLIHRDLKPANILFGQDGEVKIGDFGLVTAEKDEDTENLVERTVNKGTPSYMAPEQKKQTNYDRKVDIFALGLIFFELFWKMSSGHERQKVMGNVREQRFPPGFSGNYSQEHMIIKPMLCAKPEDRPEASKLKADLKKYIRLTIGQKNVSPGSKSV